MAVSACRVLMAGPRRVSRACLGLLAFALVASLLTACAFLVPAPRRSSLVGYWAHMWNSGHVSRLILKSDGTLRVDHMPISVLSYGFADLSWAQTVSGEGTWHGPQGSIGDFSISISFDSRIFQDVKLHWREAGDHSQLVGFYGNTEGDDEFIFSKQLNSDN